MTFKPKKQQIHVPGHGVVQKEDFTQEHFDILVKRAGRVSGGKDAFIKQHFEVASYGDQSLFEEAPEPVQKPSKGKGKGKSAVVEKTDDEKLAEMIAEEEKENASESAE